MQTSDSCSNEAKKRVSLSATKRLWILEIQYYNNKYSTMFYNGPFLSDSGKQGLVRARLILVSLLEPCVADSPWSKNKTYPPYLLWYSQWKVNVWSLPPLFSSSSSSKASICNQIWQGVVIYHEHKCMHLKIFLHWLWMLATPILECFVCLFPCLILITTTLRSMCQNKPTAKLDRCLVFQMSKQRGWNVLAQDCRSCALDQQLINNNFQIFNLCL